MFSQTKIFKYICTLLSFFSLSFLLFWFTLINSSYDSTYASLFYPILYAPREILFFCFFILSLSAFFLHKKLGILFIFVFNTLLISQLDYRFNLPHSNTQNSSIKILSHNMGGGLGKSDNNRLIRWINDNPNLSLMAFQEVNKKKLRELLDKKWHLKCVSQFCFASLYKITFKKSLDRRFLIGYGSFISHFQVTINNKVINIFNVHFDTIRRGIEELIDSRFKRGYKELKQSYFNRVTEAQIASNFINSYDNSIILGDFNTVNKSPIYNHFWSSFQNAFDSQGSGFGYTKQTRWHGVRIDHILISKDFSILNYQTGPFIKGDHRPILAEIYF